MRSHTHTRNSHRQRGSNFACLVCMPYLSSLICMYALYVCTHTTASYERCFGFECLVCMSYVYAVFVCLVSMMYALYVSLICMPCMYASYVCLTRMPCMHTSKPPAVLWQQLSRFPLVYYVEGTALEQTDLVRAGVRLNMCAYVHSTLQFTTWRVLL